MGKEKLEFEDLFFVTVFLLPSVLFILEAKVVGMGRSDKNSQALVSDRAMSSPDPARVIKAESSSVISLYL